jgi:ATP-dependent DNA helicase PIF1
VPCYFYKSFGNIISFSSTQMADVELSDKQQEALDLAVNGRNLFITGSGGVGKSFVLEQIVEQLEAKRKQVSVTASTGIAALAVGGTTLHSWAGVGQGKESAQELLKKLRFFKKAAARWRNTDVLIIDEISMLDPELFEKLDVIAKSMRRSQRPFGGMQVIAFGDFFQLSPVFDESEGQRSTDWEFVFETPAWQALQLEVIILTEVFRQRDQEFVNVLESIRHGQVTPQALELLQKRVGAKLDCSDGIEPTQLYARRAQVSNINEKRLAQLPGPEYSYEYRQTIVGCSGDAKKQVEQRLLKGCPADPTIKLRRGAQVILLVNLDQERGLVNGSRGVVVGFQGDDDVPLDGKLSVTPIASLQSVDASPIVRFANGCIEVIGSYGWRIESKQEGWNAVHSQVPLRLAWALTIHRGQGMTLDRVTVDLGSSVFGVGMSYVALSRVRTPEGLSIARLDPSKIEAHPRVLAYYAEVLEMQDLARPVRTAPTPAAAAAPNPTTPPSVVPPTAKKPALAPDQSSIKRFLIGREPPSKRTASDYPFKF